MDAGRDGGPDAGVDGGPDVGTDANVDGGTDAAIDGGPCAPRTFVVHTPTYAYDFDGITGDNPTLTLCRGVTYTFDMRDVPSYHPMDLRNGGTVLATFEGGSVSTYLVPTSAPFPTVYLCNIHAFGGTVTVP